MTHEQRTTLIQRLVFLVLILAAAVAAWFYQKPRDQPANVDNKPKAAQASAPPPESNSMLNKVVHGPQDPTPETLTGFLKNVVSPKDGVAIIHLHLQGDPASENLADTFNFIQKKYGKFVSVNRVGFTAPPKDWQGEKDITLPHVLMVARQQTVFEFQGLWSYPQVDKKVEEAIAGLSRVGKDWRPTVPGMKPKGS